MIGVLVLLLVTLTVMGRSYVDTCLPLYRSVLGLVQPEYRIRALAIDDKSGTLIRAERERQALVRDAFGQLRPANVVERASTQVGYALIHPFILFGVALVWPELRLRRRLFRLLVSLALLVLVEALDIPLALADSDWTRLMDGGGRYALCFAAAGVAAVLERRQAGRRE